MGRVLILTADAAEELEVHYTVSATGWTGLAEWSKAFREVLERAAVTV